MAADLKIVPVKKPYREELLELLDELRLEIDDGRFDSFYVIAFNPEGTFMTYRRGKSQDGLKVIGLLETLKHDVLTAMDETDKLG
jgi:hypothetical protein